MTKTVDTKIREEEILDLVIDAYTRESKPIGSSYLCSKYRLPYSSATVRNVMEKLESKGLLSHLHTSSGRVPTKEGFKSYVRRLKQEDMIKDASYDLQIKSKAGEHIEQLISHTLDDLSRVSGYASLAAISGNVDATGDEKFFFKGTRFMLEQPEFEDIIKLKSLFYTLEVKIDALYEMFFHYLDENIKIIIGDDIGFDGISDCSLVVSGSREKNISFVLAVLGPVRMDYPKAASCVYTTKNKLHQVVNELLDNPY